MFQNRWLGSSEKRLIEQLNVASYIASQIMLKLYHWKTICILLSVTVGLFELGQPNFDILNLNWSIFACVLYKSLHIFHSV